MALVINSTPAARSSVNGPLIFTVYEATKANDSITYPNYKYILDVYVAGNFISRLASFPNPVHKRGVFDLGPTMASQFKPVFDPAPGTLIAQTLGDGTFYKDVILKLGEEYGFSLYPNLVTDATRRYYNHYNRNNYTNLLPAMAGSWATNRPRARVELSSTALFIPFYPVSGATGLQFQVFNKIGVNSAAFSIGLPANTDSLWILNLSPSILNSISAGAINSSTAYYIATINGKSLRIDIQEEAIHSPKTISFLNQAGGFESILFPKVHRWTWEGDRKTYSRLPYSIDLNGVVSFQSANGVVQETNIAFNTQQRAKLKLTTDLLSDSDWTWLRELVFSPMIFLHDGANYTPARITATNYEEKRFLTDKLQPLQVELDFGTIVNSQSR